MEYNVAPYEMSMDSEQALQLAKTGGSLLILDVPPATVFGMDMEMFGLGPMFKGVKMLPPGPHFVYYSGTSRHGLNDVSPITGFFLHLASSQVIVRRWDSLSETLVKIADNSEEERLVGAVRKFEFDRHLGAYNLRQQHRWHQLTNYITADVIGRLEPVGGDISILAEYQVAEKLLGSPAEKRLIQQLQSQREAFSNSTGASKALHSVTESFESSVSDDQKGTKSSSGRCFYTPLPHLIKTVGLSARELTSLNLDKSKALDTLLERYFRNEEDLFLGEVQFSFVTFVMGQSLEGFSQWKGLISLMLSCESAPLQMRTHLFTKFLAVVYAQLKLSLQSKDKRSENSDVNEPSLDLSWFSGDNFLRVGFKDFFSLVQNAQPVDGDLLQQARRLTRLFESTLGWVFNDEVMFDPDDECAPVVVDEGDSTSISAMEN